MTYRLNWESDPVILNYFLWHFIGRKSVYIKQNGTKSSRWKQFLKITNFILRGGGQKRIMMSHISKTPDLKILDFSQESVP